MYNASFAEADICTGDGIVVVGGGNAAAQAAEVLSRFAKQLRIVVRAAGPASSMAYYPMQRIEAACTITVHAGPRIVGPLGVNWLGRIRLQHRNAAAVARPMRPGSCSLGG